VFPVGARDLPPYSIGVRPPRSPVGRALWRVLEPKLEHGLAQGRIELNDARRRVGLPALDRFHGGLSPDLCLVASFPQLEYPREWPESVHVVGPLLWEIPGIEPPRIPPTDAPLVLIAPSTSQDPQQRLLQAALEGLASTGVRVVASLDRRPPTRPLRAGRQTTLVNWLSYAEAMPKAAAVICHAGHGTVVRALASGVPLVAVPHSGDMAENAARVDWAGVGVRLPWRLLTPTTLRWTVSRVLSQPSNFAQRAAELATWSASHDGATRAAELVEQLGGSGKTRASKTRTRQRSAPVQAPA